MALPVRQGTEEALETLHPRRIQIPVILHEISEQTDLKRNMAAEVFRMMLEMHVHALPVVKEDRPVCVIERRDII